MDYSILEWIAVVSGILCVWLLAYEKIFAWVFGLISVTIYVLIFYQARLYSDTVLSGIYIILNAYGLYAWTHRSESQQQMLVVSHLHYKEIINWVLVILAGTLIWGSIMYFYTNADYAYPDAFTTCASLAAQYLLARKKIENWIIWIVVDVVAISLYLLKGLYPTTLLYVIYLGLCILGYHRWRKEFELYNRQAL